MKGARQLPPPCSAVFLPSLHKFFFSQAGMKGECSPLELGRFGRKQSEEDVGYGEGKSRGRGWSTEARDLEAYPIYQL
jgi:hypothetical protein